MIPPRRRKAVLFPIMEETSPRHVTLIESAEGPLSREVDTPNTGDSGRVPDDPAVSKRKTRSRISEMSFTTLGCPAEGASIALHEYTYQIGETQILDNISGRFLAGRLTAIMGPSGSGKTSLIETLTGSDLGSSNSSFSATRLILNGKECTRNDIAAISGFVPQDDIYAATMTVYEAIAMSADLRLPKTVSKDERKKRVEEVLAMFNLSGCAATILGSHSSRGISGGEKRRVSIAREIISNPPVLFLDEPTSGLDANTSLTVMRTLKELAEQGRTIVVTIHQPSSEIFGLIDDLVLLVGGKVAYWGPGRKAVNYFDDLGFRCPEFANPADFIFLEVLQSAQLLETSQYTSELRTKASSLDLVLAWEQSPERRKLVDKIMIKDPEKYPHETPLICKAPFFKQLMTLYLLYFRAGLRSPLSLPMRLIFACYSGLMVGLTYAMLRSNGFIDQIRGKAGALSFLTSLCFVGGFQGCLQVMWEDRTVFMRDYRSHYYDITPAYFAKNLVIIPFDFFGGILTVLIAYYMIGLNPAFSACLFVAALAGVLQVIGMLGGMVIGYTVSDPRKLIASVAMILFPFSLYGGIFIIPADIPGYLRWLVYLNPVYYAFTSAMQISYNPCNPNTDVSLCQKTVAFRIYGIDDALPAGVNLALLVVVGFGYFMLGWISLSLNCKYRSK